MINRFRMLFYVSLSSKQIHIPNFAIPTVDDIGPNVA